MRGQAKRRPTAIISDSNDSSSENSQDFVVNPGGRVVKVSSGETETTKTEVINITSSSSDSPCDDDDKFNDEEENRQVLYETLSEQSASPKNHRSKRLSNGITSSNRKRLSRLSRLSDKPKPKATQTTRRHTRSSTTGIEYTPADLISSPSADSSSSQSIGVSRKKRKTNTVFSDTESDYVKLESDNQIPQTDTDNQSEQSDIPTLFQKKMLYCIVCGEDKPIDDFSAREQKFPRHDQGPYCLLHSWAGGKLTTKGYEEEIEDELGFRKSQLKGLDRFDADYKSLQSDKYAALDGFIVDDNDVE